MKVTKNFGDLADLPLVAEDLMKELGTLAVTRIRRRTQAGISQTGSPFVALSPGYAQQKAAELGHARADLTVSGRMLNDMQVTEVSERSATIAFISSGGPNTGARRAVRRLIEGSGRAMTLIQRSRLMGANDKAFYHQEGGRVLRPFFELNEDDERALTEAAERYLEQVLDR